MSHRKPGLAAKALMGVVALWRRWSVTRPPACRYWPSCSAYALEALAGHGAAKGSLLTVRRLARCHPWGGHGVDPVPLRGHAR